MPIPVNKKLPEYNAVNLKDGNPVQTSGCCIVPNSEDER